MHAKAEFSSEPRLALVGAPMECGSGKKGAALGPAALRCAGLAALLAGFGCRVIDAGDVEPSGGVVGMTIDSRAHHATEVSRWVRGLTSAAYGTLCLGRTPIFLGGDHALSIGTIAGASRFWVERGRELFVIWLDAHADLNTPRSSPSGNLHGMALAALTGETSLLPLLDGTGAVPIDPGNVLLMGIRSVDGPEARTLAMRSFNVCDIDQLRGHRALDPLHAFLERIADARGVLHLSFDIDVIDPTIAPGVGTPAAGGLHYDEALDIMRLLQQYGLVHSLDVAELNPLLDVENCTAEVAVRLIASVFKDKERARRTLQEGEHFHGHHAD